MTANTKIEWCDHTFNPWWGCARVSPGCEHCYAEAFAKRVGQKVWGVQAERRFFGEKHWAEPLKWNRAAERAGQRARVFCSSMADVFEDRAEVESERLKLWALIRSTPSLDWLLLTKRPQNMRAMLPLDWLPKPRPNVWLGTTCEDQRRVDERLPYLLDTPAFCHFVSAEPLLERITLRGFRPAWLIIGGESGGKARPFDLDWARALIAECRANGFTRPFVKQLGAAPLEERPALGGAHGSDEALASIGTPHPQRSWFDPRQWCLTHTPDGRSRWVRRLRLEDRKGGDWSEWPDDLRLRQWPEVRP